MDKWASLYTYSGSKESVPALMEEYALLGRGKSFPWAISRIASRTIMARK